VSRSRIGGRQARLVAAAAELACAVSTGRRGNIGVVPTISRF